MPSDSEDQLTPPPASSRESPAPQSQRRSARLETKPTRDYYKINQGKASTAKPNSSVPLGSPHRKATQILYNYDLSQPDQQASEGFVRIARKKNVSKPHLPTLKKALSGAEADE